MVVNSGSKCNLLLGIYHPFHLCFHVIVLHMSVSIQGDANVRVSHQILQSFGIHTAFGHVGTKRMSANMRCDVGQLFPIELVVACTNVVEVVFPVHCNGWVPVLVKKEKTAFTVNHRLILGTRPIFNNAPEAHILNWMINRTIPNFDQDAKMPDTVATRPLCPAVSILTMAHYFF